MEDLHLREGGVVSVLPYPLLVEYRMDFYDAHKAVFEDGFGLPTRAVIGSKLNREPRDCFIKERFSNFMLYGLLQVLALLQLPVNFDFLGLQHLVVDQRSASG